MRKKWLLVLVLASLLGAALANAGSAQVSGANAMAASETIRLQNAHIQIALSAKDGRLLQIRDLDTKHDHLDQDAPSSGLWSLQARVGNERLTIRPDQARSFRWEKTGGEPAAIRLVWSGFALPNAPQLSVEVVARIEAGPMSAWEFTLSQSGPLVLEEVRFPIVRAIARQEDEYLAVPHWMGELAANPRRLLAGSNGKGLRLEWPYPGHLSMQCLAYYRQNGPGLYAACDDATAQRKTFAVWGDEKRQVHFEVVHYPEPPAEHRERQTLGYRALLGTFRGDWFTAAERYRNWAAEQVWARESRLRKGLVPDWVRETGLWVWNRGRSPQVLAPAMALQRKLDVPVSVFWHWWHGCAYDAGFPEYLPPREGTEAFKYAVGQARCNGVHALVYMNQRLWGMTTKSWNDEGAARFAVKSADGTIRPEVYNTFTRQPCASMCMGTAFWRNKYAGLAEAAISQLLVDGIYMDQACSSLACYDPSHGHALGGGRYWMEGFRTLASDIRRRCDFPETALAGEGCGEPWLPYLDLMLTLQVSRERYAPIHDGWEVIPFFHAVYHPYAVLYGNYSSLTTPPYDDLWPAEHAPAQPLALLDRKFSRQFYLEQARAFVWGQQPTIANFTESQFKERREEIEYVMRLARTRSRAQEYLLHGVLLRPPVVEAKEVTIDGSRLSIYAGQGERVKSFQKTCAPVLAAAWRSPDGNLGIALANILDEPAPVTVRLSPEDHQLPRQAKVERIDEKGYTPFAAWDREHPTAKFQLPARAAWVIEIRPLPASAPSK